MIALGQVLAAVPLNTTPAAWLCIGYTIGATLAAIAGWAARQ